MPTHSYDVIVLGDDLAGLIAATLCARRGLRVLVTATAPPDAYTVGPYTLPRTVLPFIGESSPAVRRVVAELNFIQLVRRRLALLRPSFQVILPDARIEVGPDADALGRELQRELPEERQAIEGFLARAAEVSRVLEPVLGQDVSFPPDGFWEKREIARSDNRLPAPDEELLRDPRARALAALPAAFSLPCDPRALTPTAICRAFDLWRRGAARFEGGGDALRQLFLEKLRTQHAGEVRAVAPAALSMKWGRAHGLVLAEPRPKGATSTTTRSEALGCGHLIWAAPVAELEGLVGARGPKRLAAMARAIRPTAYRFVLNVVLSGVGVAEGIAPVNFVVVDPAAALVGDNAFALHVADPDEDGRVVVTMLANAPDGESLAELKDRLLGRLEEVMPFSAEHILLAHSPNLATPDGPPPVPPEPLWSSTLAPSLGVGAVPYDAGVKAATPASAQSLLGLGLEGQFVAGWCAARIVTGAAGKKKDYLKDEVLLGT